jgi:hypothetical protein
LSHKKALVRALEQVLVQELELELELELEQHSIRTPSRSKRRK